MSTAMYALAIHLPSLAAALLGSVWQGVLLTCVVGPVTLLVRGLAPGARAWVWRVLLVLVLLQPLLLWLPVHSGAAVVHRGVHLAQGWSWLVLGMWAACSAWRGAILASGAVRLRGLARRAVPVQAKGLVQDLLTTYGGVALCVSAEVDRPSVAGFVRPRILLPAGLLETLSATELEHIVRHEVEHLRRRDHWFNLLQQAGLALFPLNPALVWLDRRLCRERELACDDGVLAKTRASRSYAACLVRLAEDTLERRGASLALSALGARAGESELMTRVRRILAPRERSFAKDRLRLGLGSLLAAAVAGVLVLASGPQWVSFDGGITPVTAQSAAPALVDVGPALAAGAAQTAGEAVVRSVPVSAAETQRPSAVAWRATSCRRVRTRTLARTRPSKPQQLPWAMVPVKVVSGAVPAARVVKTAAVTGERLTPRWAVTEFEVSQPVYAAVPWQGGWLIVQL